MFFKSCPLIKNKMFKYNVMTMMKEMEEIKKGIATKTANKSAVPKTILHYKVTRKYGLDKAIEAKIAITPGK